MAVMNFRNRTGCSSFQPDIRALTCLREELGIHQRAKQRGANVAPQPPQTLGFARCQAKSGHFYVFPLDPLKHVIDAHGAPRRLQTTFCCQCGLHEQHVYRSRISIQLWLQARTSAGPKTQKIELLETSECKRLEKAA